MKYKLVIINILFIFLSLHSCKLDNSKNNEKNNLESQKKTSHKLSLSQMETQNGKMIDSVGEKVLEQVKQKNFVAMFKEADTSLTKVIDVRDVETYFKMIDRFYGNIDTLKLYGTSATENGKTLDYIVNFSTGDSLELSYKLRFYNDNVKLSYITMNRFTKNEIPKNITSIFKPKLENIFKRRVKLVFDDCSKLFKSKVTESKIKDLLNKNLNSNSISYDLIDCKPLIFGKGQVGFIAKTQKVFENGVTKKVNVIFFLENNENFKIADILFSK